MKKSILIIVFMFIANFLYADDLYENLRKSTASKIDPVKQLDEVEKYYQGNDYLTKDEFSQVKKTIQETDALLNSGPHDFLLYFTSTSVPTKTMLNVLHQVGILQDNGIMLNSKQYFIGFPDDLETYMKTMDSKIDKHIKIAAVKEKIDRNFHLKIDPRYFYHFGLKKVPAMALAKCPNLVPRIEKCTFNYFIQGDVSLTKFFDEISRKNKKFEKYVKILQGNKIITFDEVK